MALLEGQKGSTGPPGGPRRVGSLSQRTGKGEEVLQEGRQGLGGLYGGPGGFDKVGRPSQMASRSWEIPKEGQEEWEARQESREGTAGP